MYKLLILLVISFTFHSADASEIAEKETQHRKASSFYIGGLFGRSNAEQTYDQNIVLDDEDVVFGAYGGYDFSPSFGIEFSSVFTTIDNEKTELLYVDDAYLTVISIAPKYTFNINDDIGLFVKAGLGLAIYLEDYDSDDYWSYDDSDAWFGAGLYVGAGIEIMVNEHVDFRLSADFIEAELDADNDDCDCYYNDDNRIRRADFDLEFSTVSIGMHYRF